MAETLTDHRRRQMDFLLDAIALNLPAKAPGGMSLRDVRLLAKTARANGDTPLTVAFETGEREDWVRFLLPFSDLTATDSSKNTLLIKATLKGDEAMARLFLPRSNPDQRGNLGKTALMHAVWHNNRALAEILAPVSDPKTRCLFSRTALDWAIGKQACECVDFLVEFYPMSDQELTELTRRFQTGELPRVMASLEARALRKELTQTGFGDSSPLVRRPAKSL